MRKLIFGLNFSLDGVVDHTKQVANEEVHDYFTDLMRKAGVLVYGRKTYELMFPFWPDIAKKKTGEKSMDDFAEAFSAVEKVIVFSKTLPKVDDSKTTIIQSGLKEEILKLKNENGKNIMIGGVDIPTQLIELGLVDEFHLVYGPVMVGEGRRFLDGANLQEQLKLKLLNAKVFNSGGIALRYAKG